MARESTYNPEADKKWAEKNRSHRTYLSARSTARTFLRKYAETEDLGELEALMDQIKDERGLRTIFAVKYTRIGMDGPSFSYFTRKADAQHFADNEPHSSHVIYMPMTKSEIRDLDYHNLLDNETTLPGYEPIEDNY